MRYKKTNSVNLRKRHAERSVIKQGAFVLFNQSIIFGFVKFNSLQGVLIDISLNGMKAHYKTAAVWSSNFNNVSIVNTDKITLINNIPCEKVTDSVVTCLTNDVFIRSCGIKFGKLTEYHKSQLSSFIQGHEAELETSKSWHIEFA